MGTLTSRILGTALLALLVFVPLACQDDFLGPDRDGAVSVNLTPDLSGMDLPLQNAFTEALQVVDSVHVVFGSRRDGGTSIDTVFYWPADADTLSIELEVELLEDQETFDFVLEFQRGSEVLFRSEGSTTVSKGDDSGAPADLTQDVTENLEPTVAGAGADSITVTRAPSLLRAGATDTLAAAVWAGGEDVTADSIRIVWQAADTLVTRVDSVAGIVTGGAVADDTAAVVVRVPFTPLADTVRFPVLAAGARIGVPADTLIRALADTVLLTARALDVDGDTLPTAVFRWSVADTTVLGIVATTDSTVELVSRGVGAARVVARVADQADTLRLRVQQLAAAVTVTPAVDTLALRDTLRFSATVADANGVEIPGAPVSWTVLDTTVLTVDSSGLAAAQGAGSSGVVAVSGDAADTAHVLVAAPNLTVASATITPARPDTIVEGDSLRIEFAVVNTGNVLADSTGTVLRIINTAEDAVLADTLIPQPPLAPGDTFAFADAFRAPLLPLTIDTVHLEVAVDPDGRVTEADEGDNERRDGPYLVLHTGGDPYEPNDTIDTAWDVDKPTDLALDGADGTAGLPFATVMDSLYGGASVYPADDRDYFTLTPARDTILALYLAHGQDATVALDASLTDQASGERVALATATQGLNGLAFVSLAGGRSYAIGVETGDTLSVPAHYGLYLDGLPMVGEDRVNGTGASTEPNDLSVFAGADAPSALPFDAIGVLHGTDPFTETGPSAGERDLYRIPAQAGAAVEVLVTSTEPVAPLTVSVYERGADGQLTALQQQVLDPPATDTLVATVGSGATYVGVEGSSAATYDLCVRLQGESCRTGFLTTLEGDFQTGLPGDTLPVPLTVAVFNMFEQPVSGALVRFRASDGVLLPSEVVSDSLGMAPALYVLPATPGTYTVTAEVTGGGSVDFTATVADGVDSVSVTPDTVALKAAGETVRLSATAYGSGGVLTGADITWTALDTVVTVDAAGLVTALSDGIGRVVASAGTAADTAVVQVGAPGGGVASVTVTPDTVFLQAVGDTTRLSATARDSSGTILPDAEIAWIALDTVVSVDTGGLVTGLEVGTGWVVAASGTAADTAVVQVGGMVASPDPYEPNDTLAFAWDIDTPPDTTLDDYDGVAGLPFRTVFDSIRGWPEIGDLEDADYFAVSPATDQALTVMATNMGTDGTIWLDIYDQTSGERRYRRTGVAAGYGQYTLANLAGGRTYVVGLRGDAGASPPLPYQIQLEEIPIEAHDYLNGNTLTSLEPNDFSSFDGAMVPFETGLPYDVMGTIQTPGAPYADVDLYAIPAGAGEVVEILARNNGDPDMRLSLEVVGLDAETGQLVPHPSGGGPSTGARPIPLRRVSIWTRRTSWLSTPPTTSRRTTCASGYKVRRAARRSHWPWAGTARAVSRGRPSPSPSRSR